MAIAVVLLSAATIGRLARLEGMTLLCTGCSADFALAMRP